MTEGAYGWAEPERPRALSIAVGLWIVLGWFLMIGGVVAFVQSFGPPTGPGYHGSPLAAVLVAGGGFAFDRLGVRLKRGQRDTRAALLALGVLFCVAILPAVLVVPAAILQYRSAATRWLHAVHR